MKAVSESFHLSKDAGFKVRSVIIFYYIFFKCCLFKCGRYLMIF